MTVLIVALHLRQRGSHGNTVFKRLGEVMNSRAAVHWLMEIMAILRRSVSGQRHCGCVRPALLARRCGAQRGTARVRQGGTCTAARQVITAGVALFCTGVYCGLQGLGWGAGLSGHAVADLGTAAGAAQQVLGVLAGAMLGCCLEQQGGKDDQQRESLAVHALAAWHGKAWVAWRDDGV